MSRLEIGGVEKQEFSGKLLMTKPPACALKASTSATKIRGHPKLKTAG